MAIVKKLYPDYAAMQAALPHRSRDALYFAADKWAAKRKFHVWTTTENKKLKVMWERGATRQELRDAFPDVSFEAIRCHAAQALGCGPRPRNYKEFEITALDKIRQRAKEDGFTLVELDRLCGTGRYFQQSKRKLVPKHIVKAIIALGGTMDIDWNQEA